MSNLLSKRQRDPPLFKEYDDKIREQYSERIVEKVPATSTSKEFYILVVKQSTKTTKPRILVDASAKPAKASPSLKECLEVGSALRNTLWNVLTRCRLKPFTITGDLKQAFLQTKIKKNHQDAMRHHNIP